LKKERKTCDEDPAVKTKARNVLNPPLRTAGPMLRSAATVRDCLLPREGEPTDNINIEHNAKNMRL